MTTTYPNSISRRIMKQLDTDAYTTAVVSATLLFIVVFMASTSTTDISASGLQYNYQMVAWRGPGCDLGSGLVLLRAYLRTPALLRTM